MSTWSSDPDNRSSDNDELSDDAAAGSAAAEPHDSVSDVFEGEVLFSEEGVPESFVNEDATARERDEYRDALIHLKADFENYRKRVTKQQDEQRDRATESLVEKLLPVLDTVDLAMAHGAGEEIKQIGASLSAALEREGLERIDPAGVAFDPTLHDAVAHEPGDGGEQEVTEVLRAGYRWKGRVLRPAMVKVRG